jgi:hypothetical protein
MLGMSLVFAEWWELTASRGRLAGRRLAVTISGREGIGSAGAQRPARTIDDRPPIEILRMIREGGQNQIFFDCRSIYKLFTISDLFKRSSSVFHLIIAVPLAYISADLQLVVPTL